MLTSLAITHIYWPVIMHANIKIWWFWPHKVLDWMCRCMKWFILPEINQWITISHNVTQCWLISYEIGVQQQRDQCQNFSLGHNFMNNFVNPVFTYFALIKGFTHTIVTKTEILALVSLMLGTNFKGYWPTLGDIQTSWII